MAKKNDDFSEVKKLSTYGEESLKTVSDEYAPEGFKTAEEYLEDVRDNHRLDLEADHDNRIAAMEDKRFAAGEHWDPKVLAQRAGLPCLTIDTISQFTAQLVGDWRQNRNSVKVIPSENGDIAVADIRSDLIRSIWTKSRADRVLDSAFESTVQCGDGAFRIDVDWAGEDVFDQDISIRPIDDALSVVWDRLSIDPTARDARRCFVDDTIPTKEFETQWPGCDPSNLSDKEQKSLYSQGWLETGLVKVTEHWRMIDRKRLLVMFKDGEIFSLEQDDEKKLDGYIEKYGNPVKSRVAKCRYAQMHLVTGFKILAGPFEYKLNRLPIIRMTGRTVTLDDRRVRSGLIRKMKDPARLRNFMRSVAAEQLGYAPKAQWMATEEAVEGREDMIRKAHLTRDPLMVFNDEAVFGQNVQRVEPPVIQSALLNEAQQNTQDMKDVTGIHDASLGIKSNETSGKAIMARQREGDVASITYYDNGNASIEEAGDVINQLIPQIYDATRIVRTIGEDESTKLVSINDPMDPSSPNIAIGSYDVTVTTGASYTTRRAEAAESLMSAIQVFPELMGIAGDLVVKAQDWPGAEEISARLRKTISPQLLSDKEKQEAGDQGPDAQALTQQMAQLQEQMQGAAQELQKLQQENQTLKIKHDVEMKKQEIESFKAETDRLQVLADIAKADKEFELKELVHEAEQEHQHLDRVVTLAGMEDSRAQAEQAAQAQEEAQEQENTNTSGTTASTPPSE